jgi:hypothetical protein
VFSYIIIFIFVPSYVSQNNDMFTALEVVFVKRTISDRLRVLRIFGPKRDEVTGGWRKLRNEEFHNLYSSPVIIRMIKSRRMRWAGHVARTGRRGMHIGYWLEDQDIGGWTILKWILERWGGMDWIDVA